MVFVLFFYFFFFCITVGSEHRNILHVLVLNKRCTVCDLAAARKKPAPEHECFRNWYESSTAMEAEAALQACKESRDHNLVYGKMVTDGDASVAAKLKEERVYEDLDIEIEHFNCFFHLNKVLN
jgi:hypothetical protein